MSALKPLIEAEWSLLRVACSDIPSQDKATRIRGLLTSQIQWNALLGLADRHGVQPILAEALSGLGDAIPGEELSAFKRSHETNLHKTLLLSRELIRICERLSSAGIEAMPYKGLVLAEMLYGDIALRQSGDIDLLIHARDLKRVREAVRELGYIPNSTLSESEEDAYVNSGYEYSFDGTAGKNLLEVQWAIQPRFYAVDFDMEGLFQRAVTVPVAGIKVKSPSIEDLFLLLALHAAKHAWGRLIWLCDLARISRISELNWKWIGAQAQELGIVRILRVTLLLAQNLLDSPFPHEAAELLPDDPGAAQLAGEIQQHITSDTTFDVDSVAYFRLMLRLRERRIDRMRFLSRLILTPGPGEWEILRLPKPLVPLYRVIRLGRLAARMARGLS